MPLPFATVWLPPDEGLAAEWLAEMERQGEAVMVARLSRSGGGAPSSIDGVGNFNITRGFVEDWIAYKERKRGRSDTLRFWATFAIAVATLFAAIVAAAFGILGPLR